LASTRKNATLNASSQRDLRRSAKTPVPHPQTTAYQAGKEYQKYQIKQMYSQTNISQFGSADTKLKQM